MINDQITDSVTQIINYKDGMGNGCPSRIVYKFENNTTYDDALVKYANPKEPHLPSIQECDTFHNYIGPTLTNTLYLTNELRDDNTVTLANFKQRIYTGHARKDTYPVLLIYIEYQLAKLKNSRLLWGPNKEGSFDIAWNDAYQSKKDGWRLPSVQELQDAAIYRFPGFIDGKYYWSNDWHGDPSHAGAVQMYSGAYFIGMPLYNQLQYKLVKEF